MLFDGKWDVSIFRMEPDTRSVEDDKGKPIRLSKNKEKRKVDVKIILRDSLGNPGKHIVLSIDSCGSEKKISFDENGTADIILTSGEKIKIWIQRIDGSKKFISEVAIPAFSSRLDITSPSIFIESKTVLYESKNSN